MKTIGIICACDTELKPFLPYLEQVRVSEAAMHRFYCGFLFGCPVVCVQCGVCKINAALTAQIIAERITAQFTLAAIKGLSYAENLYMKIIRHFSISGL